MSIGGGNFEMATGEFSSPRNEKLLEFTNLLAHRYPKRLKAFDGFLANEAQSKFLTCYYLIICIFYVLPNLWVLRNNQHVG